ncbi:MAG TPA: dTDP-4-dehydrorhamnose reductase [Terriglobia bacterium]|nr:dTDP-4-dehydrorhamnose reductase [Terriglobia bacterium]
MRVVVLGANGQLGSDLIRAAPLSPNLEVVPFYRKDLEVTDFAAIPVALSKVRFDVLINCTGYHKTDEAERHASQALAVNATAVKFLAEACKLRGARLLHISTDYVFGGDLTRPYRETDSPAPLNVYGASKFLGECLAWHAYAEGVIIARVASLFGVVGASGKGGNFVETMLRMGREKGHLRVVKDVTMSPTSTWDAARVILRLITERAPAGIYHLVNSGQATWFEFAREIIQRAGVAATVEAISSSEYPTPAIRPPYSVLDNAKASAVTGPIRCWEEALADYLKEKGHAS